VAGKFKHEDISAVPRGFRVRTVTRGRHEIRVAYPPGPQRRGAGRVVSILHPVGENPSCPIRKIADRLVNPGECKCGSGEPATFGGMCARCARAKAAKARERAGSIRGARLANPKRYVVTWEAGGGLHGQSDALGRKDADAYIARVKKQFPRGVKISERVTDELGYKRRRNVAVPSTVHSGYAKQRKNPDELEDAADLYREFHGRDPKEILEMQESDVARRDYAALGDLIELHIRNEDGKVVKIEFSTEDAVKLASSPNGRQLYLLGGDQDITGSLDSFDKSADVEKDLLDLGDAVVIVYDASKWQTNFKATEWKHDFGEESGVVPRAFFDRRNKRIFLAGGNYRVERPGIID
jgi:hypothetical protein